MSTKERQSDPLHRAKIQLKARRQCGRPPALCENERRERIFDAAEIVLQKYGYSGASMDRIAQSSNMSKKTLYNMFESKQEMIELLLKERLLLSGLKDLKLEGETIEAQLIFGLRALAAAIMKERRLNLIRVVIAEVSRNPEVSRFAREFFSSENGPFPLKIWLQRLKNERRLLIDNVEEAADILFGSSIATVVLCELTHCRPAQYWKDSPDYLTNAVRVFLAGIAQGDQA